MKIKTYINILLAIIALSLTSCNNKSTKTEGKTSNDTTEISAKDTTVLKIGTLSQSISYYEKNDKIMGYEYEMAEEFAKSQKKKTKYVLGKDENDLVEMLKKGDIDFIAYPIVMSNKNKQDILFTNHTYITHQVLVQRAQEEATAQPTKNKSNKNKKGNKKNKTNKVSTSEKLNSGMVKDVTQLIGKEVWVIKGSKHEERLNNLNEEVGGGIIIKACENDEDEEDLIDHVAKKEIDYMVCDEKIAKANATDYNNINVSTNVSFDQRAAWATLDSTMLKNIDKWESDHNTKSLEAALQNKYFAAHQLVTIKQKVRVNKIPAGSHEISNYDPYFKQYGKQYGIDWRLLAAIAQKESGFKPDVTGWSGSIGLMQLMPSTAKKHGAKTKEDLFDPEINIKVACSCFKTISNTFSKIANPNERMKFTLASYNAGIGHIQDAQALAKKYGKDPNKWDDNVEPFVRMKSNRHYYTDAVVKHGYANGNNICNYVARIEAQYEEYKNKVK